MEHTSTLSHNNAIHADSLWCCGNVFGYVCACAPSTSKSRLNSDKIKWYKTLELRRVLSSFSFSSRFLQLCVVLVAFHLPMEVLPLLNSK